MKIGGTGGNKFIEKLYGQNKQVENKDPKGKSKQQEGDSAKISSEAREIQRLSKKTLELNEVRQEKVDSLKGEVQSGNYSVSAKNIADKIMQYLRQ